MKKKHAEHANHERWLVSYADFITLLFAFFVVMYALSMENLSKVKAAAESIRRAFGGPAVLAPGGPGGAGGGARGGDLRGRTRLSPFPEDPSGDAHEAYAEPGGELSQMKDELDAVSGLETGATELGERMETLLERRGLLVRLTAKDFFGRGEAAVRPDLQPLLDRIGRVLARSEREIVIEGFSDPSEARPAGFASDWELSGARAAWVARYWIARFELDPRRVSISGHAHYRPLAPEPGDDVQSRSSEWLRGKNRRLEIVVLGPQGKERPGAPRDSK